MDAVAMAIDPRQLRRCLGRFATGVAVVTSRHGDVGPVGLTVNSFTSVSLDPPLILFCIDCQAATHDLFVTAAHFAVNILGADQQPISDRFAARGSDKWRGVAHGFHRLGVPLLSDSLAHLVCAREHVYAGGDHSIVIGRVLDLHQSDHGQPLLYFQGAYRCLG